MVSQSIRRHPLFSNVSFALMGLVVVGQIYLPIPILAEIKIQFATQGNEASWVSSAFSFAYAIGFLLWGPLSDKFGRRRLILLGFFFLILSTVLVAIATNFERLLLFRAVQGLSASAFPPLILAHLNETLSPPWKERAISFMSLGFLTASIVAQLYAIILHQHSFSSIELTFLPFYIISLILIFLFIENDGSDADRKHSLLAVYKKIPGLLFDTKLKWLYLSTLCTLSALVAFYILLDHSYGARFAAAHIDPFTTRLVALPAMFLSLLAPWIIMRIGSVALIRWSFSIAAAGLVLATVAILFESVWGLLLSSVVFIGGRAFSVPSLVGTVGMLSKPGYRGTAISLYTFVLFVGASIGPLMAHVLMLLSYPAAFILLAFVAGLPALLTGFM